MWPVPSFILICPIRLATLHQRHGQDRQRSDSIGRTVLQTVAQKLTYTLCRKNVTALSRFNSDLHKSILVILAQVLLRK